MSSSGMWIMDDDGATRLARTHEEWRGAWNRNRRVGDTTIGDVRVSTVFLMIDHGYSDEGPPILFETLIFGGPHDQEMWRYATRAEALAGHAAAVRLVRGETSE